MANVVLATFGSLGDLHPYLAVGLALQARGHKAVIATSASYREKIEALGLGFRPVRPDFPDTQLLPNFMRDVMNPWSGPRTVVRDYIMASLRDTYADTVRAVAGADLLVAHPLTFTVRLIAELQGVPWASTVLSPMSFFSVHDPSVFPPLEFLGKLRPLGPTFHRGLFRVLKLPLWAWDRPWQRLRADIGLPPTRLSPLFDGQHAPELVLTLYSRVLGGPQPDWPSQALQTGFPFFDEEAMALPPELERFLDAGPPPLVFTLGSSAVMVAGRFYEESAAAARLLGRRAVLVVGKDPRNVPASLPEGVLAVEYAPFAALFARAAAIVHQGGVGTTAQALRAGRPMVVVPFAFDQPDNAARVARLGIGGIVKRQRYTARSAASALRGLLDDPAVARRAEEVGRRVRAEDGAEGAARVLEELMSASGRR